ncbi:KAR9-domain-containing protein [Cucurbitaria berberidis CBS 394.84]|uniref:KAR9-domain-containing protein n=1 Tax=Cucurbitaria berberidis CBS 394.84 TaxID=1168544 RepID=A0A9P4GNC3_9PLEO|nr:KAR9-domain-containing protein [Cucurbitaria berberidis CBS 394.84]KAF1848201.1 KAR9-domain-containing protein [Cucurbitaria berberidis CBS 394.84]
MGRGWNEAGGTGVKLVKIALVLQDSQQQHPSNSAATSLVSSSSSPAAPAVNDRLPAKTPPNPTTTTTTTTTTSPSPSSSSPRPARPTPPTALESSQKLARNVSPGLLARMKFLNLDSEANKQTGPSSIGRIDEDKIRRLEDFHKDRSFNVERRGTAWSGIGPPPDPSLLEPQLTGESVPAPAMAMEPSFESHHYRSVSPPPVMEPGFESDHSSVVSTSDKVLPSESEAEADDVLDMQKYRLPDITKTKSLSQTVVPTEQPVTTATTTTTTDTTRPPTPPPKDTPPAEEISVLDDHDGINVEAYFQRRQLSRATSIYTLSKASFTNQIQGLTSMKLPPTTIASEITALPSSTLAGRALHKAANDIRLWMAKATEVLNGLDAEDDVEWAAAAGREGLAEVDAAVGKFEGLVNVYITAIEDLQSRPDISALPTKDQTTLVSQMEDIVNNWSKIKETLNGIKNQVEVAMEWEELWNNVLGEIGLEVENLSRLVFEMEERRHRVISDSVAEAPENFDIAELETIVEETPRQAKMLNNRFSMPVPPTLSVMSPISPIPQIEQENSRLLALFAKLQPLRASLDFLPMRLASFQMRANNIFPSACDELMRRKEQLEDQEKKLEAEADALREELGEDKWVHSFRQAGSKAVAMYDSCMKSIQRLQQAIDDSDEEKISTRIATYKDKRDHYPPSMKRVLELIDIEMTHRSTVNGEILRIQQDVRAKVSDLETVTKDMDMILDEFTASRKLRDSVSTVLSARTEASLSNSAVATPNSSPASSVIISRKSSDHGTMTPAAKSSRRQSSIATPKPTAPTNRRYSSLPMTSGVTIPKLAPARRLDMTPSRSVYSMQTRSITPVSERPAVKPRWNSSTNMRDTVVGHNFKPMTLTTPSQFRRGLESPEQRLRSVSSHSSIPVRSPLSRSSALSPPPSNRPTSTTPAHQPSRRPLASPMQSPGTPARSKLSMRTTPGSSTKPPTGTPTSGRRVETAQDVESPANEGSPSARRTTRSASAMNNRRSSLLPAPKTRTASTLGMSDLTPATTPGRSGSRLGSIGEGRNSRAGDGRASRVSGRQSSQGDKAVWR